MKLKVKLRVKLRAYLGLGLAALVLTACDTVTSPVPLGERPAPINAEKWEGRWANAEGYLDLTVVDAKNGLVQIAYQEDGECENLRAQLRTSGEWLFFNVTEADFEKSEGLAGSPCSPADSADPAEHGADGEDEQGEAPSYLWGRVLHRGDSIIAWSPSVEVFARLVKQGRLPGTVEDDNVVLGPLGPEHYAVIVSGAHGVVLDWERPLVLFRSPAEGQAD